MNERQRDLFLYLWSRRRAPGARRIMLRGAARGALGGIAFATIMMHVAGPLGAHGYDYAGQLTDAARLLALSVAAFAAIGWTVARRVWRSPEGAYQALLAAGARVPDAKPALRPADRGPMLAVAVTVVALAGCIAWLLWAASAGRL